MINFRWRELNQWCLYTEQSVSFCINITHHYINGYTLIKCCYSPFYCRLFLSFRPIGTGLYRGIAWSTVTLPATSWPAPGSEKVCIYKTTSVMFKSLLVRVTFKHKDANKALNPVLIRWTTNLTRLKHFWQANISANNCVKQVEGNPERLIQHLTLKKRDLRSYCGI